MNLVLIFVSTAAHVHEEEDVPDDIITCNDIQQHMSANLAGLQEDDEEPQSKSKSACCSAPAGAKSMLSVPRLLYFLLFFPILYL